MDPNDNDDDYGDGDNPPLPIKITAMNEGDDGNGGAPPVPPDGGGFIVGDNINPEDDEDDEFDEEEDDEGDVDVLPEFANDYAKDIHVENKKLKELLEKVEVDAQETKKRLAIMEEHLKNVGQEVGHTTELVNAKKKEIESEDHLTQLVVREAGRYQQEFKRMTESIQVSDEKLNLVQNSIFKGNQKMDAFKLEMNWNQEELEQWALAAKQKEDDNLALQKYTRADEVKIKEVSLLMEKLTQAVIEAKTKVENEETETAARQIELDRTAEEFRAAHEERQVLVRQWQDTIEAMRARDATVQELAVAYAEERDRLAEQLKILSQQREHLESLKSDNEDLEAKITQLEMAIQRRREERTSSQEKLQEFTDELDVVKHELQASATQLAKRRNQNTAASRDLEEKKKALAEARQAYQETKKNLDIEIKDTEKTELSAKEAEKRMADAEAELKKREFSLQAIKEDTFKQSQALFALRQEEARMISEISGAQSTAKNLQGRIRGLDQESIRQQELIYNGEFQIQQMERKVSRGLGERSDEETKVLKKEIAGLENEVDAAKNQKKMLVAQCRKLNLELRAALRKKDVAVKAAASLNSNITELESENESLGQTLDSLARKKEDQMVNNDIMRLEVKRLRDLLNNKTDKVFSLENRKQQLALSMEERKHEINVHQNVQRAQLRAADEERHRVTIELGGRRQAVEKLRDKYETLCKVSGVRSDEDGGEPKSQAYYLIKAAQKREELQRQGDELDQNIRVSEKEIKALTTTLKHLANQNTNFRAAHQKVKLSNEDAEKIHQLEEQSKMTSDTLFKKKKELSRLQTDLEEDGRRMEQVMAHLQRLEERNRHLENAKLQMESELEMQRAAVDKITRRVMNFSQTHREKTGLNMEDETLQEKDFRCEAMEDTMTNALYTLGQLAEEYPEIKDQLFSSLQAENLSIPSKPATRAEENGFMQA